MSAGFRVPHEVLDAQARGVDELAGRMRVAADAGRPIDVGAYGVVGQVFAAAAVTASAVGSAAVGLLADGTSAIADGLRATRAGYAQAEGRNIGTFRGLR